MKCAKNIARLLFSTIIYVSTSSCNDQSMNDNIDRSLGLFPHSLGNSWVKNEYKDCSGDIRMDIISSFKTDTADFFEVRHLRAPCRSSTNKSSTRWYAEDLEGRIYVVGNGFKYLCLYIDMDLNLGDRFIRMGLMDYVIEKTENRIVTEYDNYEEYKANSSVFEKGLGLNPDSWSTIKISNVTYVNGIDY
jgi:hypothetical protein